MRCSQAWENIHLVRMTNHKPGTRRLDRRRDHQRHQRRYLLRRHAWVDSEPRRQEAELPLWAGDRLWDQRRSLSEGYKNPLTGRTGSHGDDASILEFLPDAVARKDEWRIWEYFPGVCQRGTKFQVIHVGHGATPARFLQGKGRSRSAIGKADFRSWKRSLPFSKGFEAFVTFNPSDLSPYQVLRRSTLTRTRGATTRPSPVRLVRGKRHRGG